jgi:anthranilate phosphoribosyltransferase
MEYLGYQFTNEEEVLRRKLEEAGICFLHAPLFHPAMKFVAPVRKELGVKTFFNMLGPMVNPAFPGKQMVGVFSLELARLYAYLYQQTNKRFVIIHALDGYDEISLTGNFKMISNNKEQVLSPEQLGMPTLTDKDLFGGSTVAEAGKIFVDVLQGKGTLAQNAAVIANAGVALHGVNPHMSLSDAMARARESLISKKALQSFEKLMA